MGKWCEEEKTEFQSKFDTSKIEEVSLLNILDPNNISKYDMDNIAKKLVNIPNTAGVETGISKQSTQSNNTPRPKDQNKPWFDRECHLKCKQHFREKNRLKRINPTQNEKALNRENKSHKKFINKKRHVYNKKLHKKLRNFKS